MGGQGNGEKLRHFKVLKELKRMERNKSESSSETEISRAPERAEVNFKQPIKGKEAVPKGKKGREERKRTNPSRE